MRFILLLLIVSAFQSCLEDGPPYIRYAKGDTWMSKWRNNSFTSKAFVDDKIYCSSINLRDTSEWFYCLNLKTGIVDWAAEVNDFAAVPPIVADSFIYYCSYLGDIYKFDKQGNKIWERKAESVYGGKYCLNPLNNNLIIQTVTNGAFELACSDGAVVNHFGKHSQRSSLPVFLNSYMIQAGVNPDTTVMRRGILLRCIDYVTKKIIWEHDTGECVDRLFINKSNVYFVTEDLRMHCVDITTGERLWQTEPLNYHGAYKLGDNIAFDQGKVICWGQDLSLFLILDEETGRSIVKTSYPEILDYYLIELHNYKYMVKAGEKQYTVRVSDGLEGSGREYNVEVIRN